jgi:hypothetical protein
MHLGRQDKQGLHKEGGDAHGANGFIKKGFDFIHEKVLGV